MRWRFSLRHDPQLPIFNDALWETDSGDVAWDIDSTPSVTLPGPASSSILADMHLLAGSYTLEYDISVTNTGLSNFNLVFLGAGVGASSDLFSGAGNFTGTIDFDTTATASVVRISFSNFAANTKTFTINRFILRGITHEINEPDGWKGANIILERDPEFFSLVERYEGSANGAFIFYGDNGVVDGGVNYVREVEENYGFDENVVFTAELAIDNENYTTLFEGLLELSGKQEFKDNRMQIPVVRDDFWSKFINRIETPIDLSSNTDLDGKPVDPVLPISINLTPQKVRKIFQANYTEAEGDPIESTNEYDIPGNGYGIIDFEDVVLDEIEERFSYINTENTEIPFEMLTVKYGGAYNINFNINASSEPLAGVGSNPVSNLEIRIQINEDSPFTASKANAGTPGINGQTNFTFNQTLQLNAKDQIRIYYENTSGSTNSFFTNGKPFSYITITADTIYPATQAPGYLIHDVIHGVLSRMGLGDDPLYSEFLGSTLTTTRQYGADGCGWMYAILKGIHIRGYTLSNDKEADVNRYTLQQKPFITSFKQLWDGINPILNLGLGYETLDGSPEHQVIRIEEKDHFLEDNISLNISNVSEISSSYDQDFIFKTIKVGYKKWQSENSSGNDDPQTKRAYATRFVKTGKELNLESEFIAASLAIEETRRTSRVKSEDYKFDNDNFIISLNTDDVSPDVYRPELDENFTSVTNLLNSDSRYNLVLTPLRNFFRWANYIGGCLQDYTTSYYRFVSGEGNYDMTSDATLGSCERAVISNEVSESEDIPLGPPSNYNIPFGYLFLPQLYDIKINMSWEDYQAIKEARKQALGISQTGSGHTVFKIKSLSYDIVNAQMVIKAWPKTFFRIEVIQ